MKVINNEFRGFSDYVVLNPADLIAIGTGGTKVIATVPIGGAVELVGVINTIDIVGSSTLEIDVGTTIGDPNEFIEALDVDGMTVNVPTYNTGTAFVQTAGNTTIEGGSKPVGGTATAKPVYLKITDAAVASITAGQIVIGLRILDLVNLR